MFVARDGVRGKTGRVASGSVSEITMLDGGMGKELRRIGAPFRQPEWSSLALMESPAMVKQAHRNFVDAGAQVITTNNYAVVPFHHPGDFTVEMMTELTRLAGRLAREVADSAPPSVRVAGCLPPLFGSFEPEHFDPIRGAALYNEIVLALDPFVDLWIGETLSCTAELSVAAQAVASKGSGQPVWMSFCLPNDWIDDRVTLRSGESPTGIVAAAMTAAVPIEALLFNCSLPEQTGRALRELRAAIVNADTSVRTGAYANAFPLERGDKYRANEVIFNRREDMTAERYAEHVGEWIDDGATIVGGCCDMHPEHIAELVARFGRSA